MTLIMSIILSTLCIIPIVRVMIIAIMMQHRNLQTQPRSPQDDPPSNKDDTTNHNDNSDNNNDHNNNWNSLNRNIFKKKYITVIILVAMITET